MAATVWLVASSHGPEVTRKNIFSTATVDNVVHNLRASFNQPQCHCPVASLPRFSAAAPPGGFRSRTTCSSAMRVGKLRAMHPITPHPRGRVLAVDDSPVIRALVTASLEALGYSVEAVDSGHAALEASRLENFDVVVLDVDMPGMDGLEVGRALRRDPKTCSAMIAMHTSLDEALVRAGFDKYDAFLPKPCDVRLLGESIDRMVRDQRRRGE
jgi:CheY-like chemotaxis protein